jgi:hypothetical protein
MSRVMSGESRQFGSKSASDNDAVRNFCPVCGGLVFGGEAGNSDSFSIYAGSLDDPSSFPPTVVIFTRDRPAWALIPPELRAFETLLG